jgi:hypothetical protein
MGDPAPPSPGAVSADTMTSLPICMDRESVLLASLVSTTTLSASARAMM